MTPDWSLIRAITREVDNANGAIHRSALAEHFHLPAYGQAMSHALVVAYRLHRIDFCGHYVVRSETNRRTR